MKISEEDIEKIVSSINNHVDNCRFTEIDPNDLKAMVDSHKKFNLIMDDSKMVVRRFVILAVCGAAGSYFVYGWWAKIIDSVKKAITG